MEAVIESCTWWQATPSMSSRRSPASSMAAMIARSASVRVLTPEFLDSSVMPMPAMAALSRNGWALTVATLGRSG